MKRKQDTIIASLTSYPARIGKVHIAIKTIIEQSLPPDEIWLTLSDDQFPNREKDLPYTILNLVRSGILFIRWVNGDLKPHKKYFYVMQDRPEAIIITFDDDILYKRDVVEVLYKNYIKDPVDVLCVRAHSIVMEKYSIAKYGKWLKAPKPQIGVASHKILATGVGGVLYPPNCFPKEVFDEDSIKELALSADDLWLKAMEILTDRKVKLVCKSMSLSYVADTQNNCLFNENFKEGGNDICMSKLINKYPIIMERLKDNAEQI